MTKQLYPPLRVQDLHGLALPAVRWGPHWWVAETHLPRIDAAWMHQPEASIQAQLRPSTGCIGAECAHTRGRPYHSLLVPTHYYPPKLYPGPFYTYDSTITPTYSLELGAVYKWLVQGRVLVIGQHWRVLRLPCLTPAPDKINCREGSFVSFAERTGPSWLVLDDADPKWRPRLNAHIIVAEAKAAQ